MPRSAIATSTADSPTPTPASRCTSRRPTSTRDVSSSTSRRCRTASTSRKRRPASRTGSASRSRAVAISWRRTAVGLRGSRDRTSTPPLRPTGPTPHRPSTRGSSPPRCTASTGPTAMPTAGVAAATAPSGAPRTPPASGTASSPTSSGHRWRSRTCSRSACTHSGFCATGSTRSSTPSSPVGAATCSRASTRRNEMPSPR